MSKSKELGPVQTDILEYFKEATGRDFRTTKGLGARLAEGYTIEDVKAVIYQQAKEWMGTEYQKHLCPETLFRPANFEKYLNNAKQSTTEIVKEGPKSTRDMTLEDHACTAWADGL